MHCASVPLASRQHKHSALPTHPPRLVHQRAGSGTGPAAPCWPTGQLALRVTTGGHVLARPCLTHPRLMAVPGRSYCEDCQRAKDRDRLNAKSRRRASAPGTNAARRLRWAVNQRGQWMCSRCSVWKRAADLEVDHRTPLADGGLDVEQNVHVLCKPCHTAKTKQENSRRERRR
jgi:5-methylcytosine-specific restriction enzyme A